MPRETPLYARWAGEMRRKRFFRAGERVGAAVSGGPDSVLLLHFLKQLGRGEGFTVAAVHFNHHLRGAESDADERFVKDAARDLGLPFFREEAEVAKAARARKRNLEAVARELRYRFFFSLVNRGELDKVATAHTASDQAETVLLKLLRGTGTRGLAGIFPVLEGKIVRPFLGLRRAEVEAELARRKLPARTDSSNLDTKLRRNKLRLELLPRLEREFNPQVASLLAELAERSREDEEVLEAAAREHARPWRVRQGDEERIPVRALADFPRAIARRVLRQMALAARASPRAARVAPAGLTHRHVEALRRFALDAQSGKRLALVDGLEARREFEWLVLSPPRPETREKGYSYEVRVPGEVHVAALGLTLRFKIAEPVRGAKAYNETEPAGLNPLKLDSTLTLRNWKEGDRYQPAGSERARKLKELFLERRIPAGERKLWPVLASGGQIAWVRGFQPAAFAAAERETARILLIEEVAGGPTGLSGQKR